MLIDVVVWELRKRVVATLRQLRFLNHRRLFHRLLFNCDVLRLGGACHTHTLHLVADKLILKCRFFFLSVVAVRFKLLEGGDMVASFLLVRGAIQVYNVVI